MTPMNMEFIGDAALLIRDCLKGERDLGNTIELPVWNAGEPTFETASAKDGVDNTCPAPPDLDRLLLKTVAPRCGSSGTAEPHQQSAYRLSSTQGGRNRFWSICTALFPGETALVWPLTPASGMEGKEVEGHIGSGGEGSYR